MPDLPIPSHATPHDRAYARLRAELAERLPEPLYLLLLPLLGAVDALRVVEAEDADASRLLARRAAAAYTIFGTWLSALGRLDELLDGPEVEHADPRSHDRAQLATRLHTLADEIASGAGRAPDRGAGAVRQLDVQFGTLIVPVAIHDVLCGWRVATDQEPDAPGLLACAGCGLAYRLDDQLGRS